MSSSIIYVDCDGVLADMVTPLLDAFNCKFGTNYRYYNVTQFEIEKSLNDKRVMPFLHELVEKKYFATYLPTYENVSFDLSALRTLGRVVALTAPLKDASQWIPQRMFWLKKHGFDENDIIFCSSKELCHGDYLIEDNIDTAIKWAKANPRGKAFLIDRPWNRQVVDGHDLIHRVHDLSEVVLSIKLDYPR